MNTITKIATALPALALLSACATTASTTPETTDTPAPEKSLPLMTTLAATLYLYRWQHHHGKTVY